MKYVYILNYEASDTWIAFNTTEDREAYIKLYGGSYIKYEFPIWEPSHESY